MSPRCHVCLDDRTVLSARSDAAVQFVWHDVLAMLRLFPAERAGGKVTFVFCASFCGPRRADANNIN